MWSYIDLYGSGDDVKQKTANLQELLQALIGCPALPTSICSGLIVFDHSSSQLTVVNTCAPSITFRRLHTLQDYDAFQNTMQNIVCGELGFGLE